MTSRGKNQGKIFMGQRKLKEITICMTTGPSPYKESAPIIMKQVKLLLPLCKEIFVIGYDLPEFDSKMHVISLHPWGPAKSLLLKGVKFVFSQLDICLNMLRILKKCDIVLLTYLTDVEIMPALISKLFRKKVIMLQGGSYQKGFELVYGRKLFGLGMLVSWITGLFASVTHTLSDIIIVDTERVIQPFGLSKYESKVRIYQLGYMLSYIDTDVFKVKRDLRSRQNLVGYIGHFIQEKGVINFVRAIPLILAKNKDIEFIMVGGGALLGEIKEELKASQSDSKVTLLGKVPHEKIPDYLNEFKLLVIPSYIEGAPRILQEAAACGTPILATSVGGIPDFVKDGESGFLLEDNSPESIAKGIITALGHQELYKIAEKAHNLVAEQCNYELGVQEVKNILQELVEGKPES